MPRLDTYCLYDVSISSVISFLHPCCFELQVLDNMRRVCRLNKLKCNVNYRYMILLGEFIVAYLTWMEKGFKLSHCLCVHTTKKEDCTL